MLGFIVLTKLNRNHVMVVLLLLHCFFSSPASALTANKVWFEFHPFHYRVVVQYTLPALREKREAYADFYDKKKAESFYWKLIKGADFVLGSFGEPVFLPTPRDKDPW